MDLDEDILRHIFRPKTARPQTTPDQARNAVPIALQQTDECPFIATHVIAEERFVAAVHSFTFRS